jgi:hypothetical protein
MTDVKISLDSEFLSCSALSNMEMTDLKTATKYMAMKCNMDFDPSKLRVWMWRCNICLPQEEYSMGFP